MLRNAFCIATLLFAQTALAECWVVGNLSGQSAKAFERYAISSDGLSGQTFNLMFSGTTGAIKPSNGMSCSQTTSASLLCIGRSGLAATVEVWTVDAAAKKVYYTQTRSGNGPLDGASLFVGDVLARCE